MPAEPAQRPRVEALTPRHAWTLLLQVRARVQHRGPITEAIGVQLSSDGTLVETSVARGTIVLRPEAECGWSMPPGPSPSPLPAETAALLDLFAPLCVGPRAESMVVAHLAQSLDGRVATSAGSSQFISGREDLEHTHRLRALFDAVLVGARTIEHDDPRLTTRLVDGPSPTRVIVDPWGRLGAEHRVFADGAAPTVLVRGHGSRSFEAPEHTRVLELETVDGWIPVASVVEALATLGLRRLFVEGGGITVSGFIEARAVDRLHITVAPVLMGSGRPAIALPEIESLDEALRVSCRHFSLGRDMLFDCPLPR